jgi:hypothetical protein
MLKPIKLILLFLTGMTCAVALAQSSPTAIPVKHYKADFVVKEVDATGHVVNSRSYSTILATTNEGSSNQIRSGDRIPIHVGSKDGKEDIQYIDIGVSIDCRKVQELDQKLAMSITTEISSVPADTNLAATPDPLIRTFKWNADVLISPGVPTIIFSSDDVSSKNKIQLEVTATPIK